MSLSLAFGILVADLTNLHSLTAAGAKAGGSGGVSIAVHSGRVVGERIIATKVLVNGVATNGVFLGSVAIAESFVSGIDPVNITGAFPHVAADSGGAFPHEPDSLNSDGAFPHVSDSSGGAFPHVADSLSSGGAFPHDVTIDGSSGVALLGGSVIGDNVKVVDGVITGENLTVVGTVVSKPAQSRRR